MKLFDIHYIYFINSKKLVKKNILLYDGPCRADTLSLILHNENHFILLNVDTFYLLLKYLYVQHFLVRACCIPLCYLKASKYFPLKIRV